MVVNESIWKDRKLFDGKWMHMRGYEYTYMNQYEGIWKYMTVYECKW